MRVVLTLLLACSGLAAAWLFTTERFETGRRRLPAPNAVVPRAPATPTPGPQGEPCAHDARGLLKLQIAERDRYWQSQMAALEERLRETESALALARGAAAARSEAPRPPRSESRRAAAPPATTVLRRREAVPRPAAVTAVGEPRVQLLGSDALISGRLRNKGDAEAHITLYLELLVDQRTYDRTYLQLRVPAGSSLPYSHRFPTMMPDGTYSARATISH